MNSCITQTVTVLFALTSGYGYAGAQVPSAEQSQTTSKAGAAEYQKKRAKIRDELTERKRRSVACMKNRKRLKENRQLAKLSKKDVSAQDAFNLIEADFQAYKAIKIAGAAEAMSKAVKETKLRLKDLEVRYSEILKFRSDSLSIAALYRRGRVLQLFAEKLYASPIPSGLNEDERDVYQATLEDLVLPIEDEAVHKFEFALKRARELSVDNQWTDRLLMALNQYKPLEYPICP